MRYTNVNLILMGLLLCFFVFIFPLGEKRMTKSNRYTKGLTDFGWGWGGGGGDTVVQDSYVVQSVIQKQQLLILFY